MKKLIVTAATTMEIEALIQFLEQNYNQISPRAFTHPQFQIHLLISGVGMMNSAFAFGSCLGNEQFDAAIQVGIAGSFDKQIVLGTLVAVASEQYGDLGAEDHERFINIFDLGFIDPNSNPFEQGKLMNPNPNWINHSLDLVDSISVNMVSGQQETISKRLNLFNPQIENMEGMAFHYACLKAQIPFLQIRAISNFVTPRDKSSWDIKLAIDNLNQYLIHLLNTQSIKL